jgi:hypothetical protein
MLAHPQLSPSICAPRRCASELGEVCVLSQREPELGVAAAGEFSIYLKALTGPPPGWFISASYTIGIALIVLFALASGSVIYPRLHGIRLTGSAESWEAAAHLSWWQRIRVWHAQFNNAVYIEYSSGFRPTAQNGNLMWKVCTKPGELDTRFKVWHDKSRWHLGGQMFLADQREAHIPWP